NAKAEFEKRYETLIDARPLVNQFLGGFIRSMRAVREGVLLSVGGGQPVEIAIEELPLDARLLSIIYGRPDSLSIKGHWTEKELAALGAAANLVLAAIDLIMAQNLNVDGIGTDTFSNMKGISDIIAVLGGILND